MPVASHVMQTVEEAYEVAIRLEHEFIGAQRCKDYQARSDEDDLPGKRQRQRYQQTQLVLPSLFVANPELMPPLALLAPLAQQPKGTLGACFYCKQVRHFKRECPKLQQRRNPQA